MRISPSNNINFGYNKKLNRRLNEKLQSAPQTSAIRLIKELNSFCNTTESDIVTLESEAYGGIDRNEEQINVQLPVFMMAKRQLCSLVERFFPELDFLKTTLDTLENEDEARIDLYEKLHPFDKVKLCYNWRDELFQALDVDLEQQALLVSTPNLRGVGVGLDESGTETLLQKYESDSSSPKSLNDVVGLDEQIEDIEDLVLYPLSNPQEASQRELDYGIKIPHFVMLYGPPGCGKTMIAQALSTQSGCEMYMIDLSQVGSTFVNGTVINIAKAFNEAAQIAQGLDKPLLLFMDEMDSILSKRDDSTGANKEDSKVVNSMLPLIESAKNKNIIIVGATNMYDKLDVAVKRRAKHNKIYIGLPKEKDIIKLLQKQLGNFRMGQNLASNQEELEKLAKELLGYSASDICSITEKAAIYAYRAKREVGIADFTETLSKGSWEKINEQDYLPENKKRKVQIGIQY